MKRLLLASLFTVLIFSAKAQYTPFPDSAVVWRLGHPYSDYFNGTLLSTFYYIGGDTLIGTYTYKKALFVKGNQIGQNTFNNVSYGYAGAYRNDIPNKKVYFVPDTANSEYLLYDFDLNIGDTLPATLVHVPNLQYPSVVTSIGSITFNNIIYYRTYNYTSNCAFSGSTYLIEGIGDQAGVFREIDCMYEIPYSYISYVCYNSNPAFCIPSGLTTINGLESISSEISISPNPSSGIFTLQSTAEITTIEIYNVLGEEVYKSEVKSQKEEINLSNQPSGIYFVKVITDEKVYSRKIIID